LLFVIAELLITLSDDGRRDFRSVPAQSTYLLEKVLNFVLEEGMGFQDRDCSRYLLAKAKKLSFELGVDEWQTFRITRECGRFKILIF
jgi:hypothetical protein